MKEFKAGDYQWLRSIGTKRFACGKCDPKDIIVAWKETLHEI